MSVFQTIWICMAVGALLGVIVTTIYIRKQDLSVNEKQKRIENTFLVGAIIGVGGPVAVAFVSLAVIVVSVVMALELLAEKLADS